MANKYMDKAVYIRETTDGKTKWVKIPGVTIQNGWASVRVFIESAKFTQAEVNSWDNSLVFVKKGRAE